MTPVERPCVFCGGEVTSEEPDVDYCRGCFYSGESWRRAFSTGTDLLGRLGDVEQVVSVDVWHTGGGCFNLAVRLDDGRLLTPSVGHRDEAGAVWAEPGFPEQPDERWAMVVSESEEAWSEWDEARLEIPQRLYTEDELVEAVREIAARAPA